MRCLHMSGAGNDFMVIDGRGLTEDYSALAQKLCAITGADGFMAVDYAENADFRLHYYNSDGSRGELCGNGSRCICKFAYDLGLAGEEMTIQTDAGLVYGWHLSDTQYKVRLPRPVDIDLEAKPGVAYAVCGVPHALVEQPGLEWSDKEQLRSYATQLRHDPVFPHGANVDFYCWLDETTVRVLSYERGVEDFTLACGTGCGALSAALYAAGKLPGKQLQAENPGGILRLTVDAQGGLISGLLLEGPAEVLGEYEV
ncbi:MAG: diaminopimelate epimerase [Oscillospiraceae bacterium]|nr:diaminopimelate epimerase [Oscillospiraceae bacterium]